MSAMARAVRRLAENMRLRPVNIGYGKVVA
jgi:hypothetical protein